MTLFERGHQSIEREASTMVSHFVLKDKNDSFAMLPLV